MQATGGACSTLRNHYFLLAKFANFVCLIKPTVLTKLSGIITVPQLEMPFRKEYLLLYLSSLHFPFY